MKRVDGLFEQVCAFETLWKATERAAKGKRQRKDVQAFLWDREAEILRLQEELRSGGYEPGRLRHFWVCDPKARRISAAGFRDRVVHHALCGVLEPHLEAYATRDSYACRKGKGSLRALEAAQTYARRYPYVLKLDIERFFESIDHGVLQAALERKFGERALHRLFAKILGVPLEGSREGKGLPIGNLTSQHFANFYLGRLDHAAKESVHGRHLVLWCGESSVMGCFVCAARDRCGRIVFGFEKVGDKALSGDGRCALFGCAGFSERVALDSGAEASFL
ncbi:hypothetical protein L6R29_21055 [Myxococcota bacterium]|nr:hypothetical protein [Myxococcota bacterium]